MGKTSRLPEPQDQHRRLTHAHAAAAGGTRHRAPAPNLSTASNGPKRLGDGRRHATTSLSAHTIAVSQFAAHRQGPPTAPGRRANPQGPVSSPRVGREAADVFLKCQRRDRRRTISLGMIVTVSLDLPKRRSARILTSPRVTVSPRNRPPYRARNGHAYGSGGRRCRLANLCAGLARRRCCRADSEDRSAYVSDHAHRGAAAHSCSADHPGARAGRMADLPSIVQRYITSTWPRGRCRKRPS